MGRTGRRSRLPDAELSVLLPAAPRPARRRVRDAFPALLGALPRAQRRRGNAGGDRALLRLSRAGGREPGLVSDARRGGAPKIVRFPAGRARRSAFRAASRQRLLRGLSVAAFAVWLTGLPASGKSAIARALLERLQARGIDCAVLESDVLRTLITPRPRYDAAERELFYAAMAQLGEFLVQRGVPVVFDATANRRSYRDAARRRIARFAEVFVDCPLETCQARDPKGLYRHAREGRSSTLPGAQTDYEAPLQPELVVHGDRGNPADAAREVEALLERRGWLAPTPD
ncbi:MAG: adenylyl-sulfate kinase [Betaproteobacteria bacterium]|nr:MAG: adenylyl-sulfate kinase [Betaproteobacteria bacterium]